MATLNIPTEFPGGPPDPKLLAENNGPMMLGVVWPLWSLAALFIALRFYAKYSRGRRPWWDDYTILAAWFALLVDIALATRLTQMGYGKHAFAIDPSNIPSMNIIGAASGTFTLTAIAWSKTSFALTLLRITTGWLRRAVWVIIISMNIALGVTALVHWVSCRPVHKFWDTSVKEGFCWPMEVISIVDISANAYSASMDFLLALFPWYIIKGLQMQRREKLGVAVAMSMGIFAGVTAIVKCTHLTTLNNPDFPYEGPYLTIWGTAEVATTIVASSIPVLRVFVREISSSAGRNYNTGATGVGSLHISGRHGGSRSRSDHEHQDDDSDKHIFAAGTIMRTTEIAVDYHGRDDFIGYEMGGVRPVND